MDKTRKPKKVKQSKIRKAMAKQRSKKTNPFDKLLGANRGGFRQ